MDTQLAALQQRRESLMLKKHKLLTFLVSNDC
jgi:hypothetical protein